MTSGNPVLDKNLDCIARYNPQLKEDLLNLDFINNKIELNETKLKEPNLFFNEIPLHSQEGAELEAKATFNTVENTPRSRHIVFGIGLGHLFKECCERSKGIVFLLETNLEILRVTLELVDFSKELSQNNVFVASGIDAFKKLYVRNMQYKSNLGLLILSSYKNHLYKEELPKLNKQIEVIVGSTMIDFNTLKYEEFLSIEAVLNNLQYTLKATPLAEIKDCYRGKTALIVSPGPTLDSNIETIKKNRDKTVIFCVGQALKPLVNKGITPDFVIVAESRDFSSQLRDVDLSEINLILEPYSNIAFYQFKPKRLFTFASRGRNANIFWSKLTNTDISHYLARGTVSYSAMASAKILGCTKFVLVGQDLAYINNQCYSGESTFGNVAYEVDKETGKLNFNLKEDSKIEAEELDKKYAKDKVSAFEEKMYYVKGINGEMLPSLHLYAIFINNFVDFAKENPNFEFINTSMLGAQIDGFENLELEKAIADSQSIDKREITTEFEHDKESVLANLESENQKLKNILSNFDCANQYIYNYDRDFKRGGQITKDSIKYVKSLLDLYNRINSLKNPLYSAISYNEDIEVMFKLDETKEFDTESVKELFSLLKEYFFMVREKTQKTIEIIEKQKENISESTDPKS